MKKIHLHDEQFDGHLHAACHRSGDQTRIVDEDTFENLPKSDRCSNCSKIWFPNGER